MSSLPPTCVCVCVMIRRVAAIHGGVSTYRRRSTVMRSLLLLHTLHRQAGRSPVIRDDMYETFFTYVRARVCVCVCVQVCARV